MPIFDFNYTRHLEQSQAAIDNISHTGKDVFIPLVLKLLHQWNSNIVSADDTETILKFLESYIVRRDIIGIPTNSLGPTMISMLNHSNALSDFKTCINNLPERQRMPNDAEMQTQLQLKDFYHLNNSYYYLERIERYLNPAFSLNDPTIEHVLPETMHTTAFPKPNVAPANVDDYNWELDLGASAQTTHDQYQHTLGNLTILPRGENARIGDYRFSIKKNWSSIGTGGFNYGYLYTPIRMSQSLGRCNIWDKDAILNRCSELVGYICAIWPHP